MSMNCKRYEQDLLLLAHGQLETHEQAGVRAHLQACAPCGERLTQLTSISFLIADAVQTSPAPPPLTLPSRPSFFPAKQSWLLSVFLGACIVVSVFSVWKSVQSYASPSPAISAGIYDGVDSCATLPKAVTAASPMASPSGINETPCPLHRRRKVVPSPSAPPRKP